MKKRHFDRYPKYMPYRQNNYAQWNNDDNFEGYYFDDTPRFMNDRRTYSRHENYEYQRFHSSARNYREKTKEKLCSQFQENLKKARDKLTIFEKKRNEKSEKSNFRTIQSELTDHDATKKLIPTNQNYSQIINQHCGKRYFDAIHKDSDRSAHNVHKFNMHLSVGNVMNSEKSEKLHKLNETAKKGKTSNSLPPTQLLEKQNNLHFKSVTQAKVTDENQKNVEADSNCDFDSKLCSPYFTAEVSRQSTTKDKGDNPVYKVNTNSLNKGLIARFINNSCSRQERAKLDILFQENLKKKKLSLQNPICKQSFQVKMDEANIPKEKDAFLSFNNKDSSDLPCGIMEHASSQVSEVSENQFVISAAKPPDNQFTPRQSNNNSCCIQEKNNQYENSTCLNNVCDVEEKVEREKCIVKKFGSSRKYNGVNSHGYKKKGTCVRMKSNYSRKKNISEIKVTQTLSCDEYNQSSGELVGAIHCTTNIVNKDEAVCMKLDNAATDHSVLIVDTFPKIFDSVIDEPNLDSSVSENMTLELGPSQNISHDSLKEAEPDECKNFIESPGKKNTLQEMINFKSSRDLVEDLLRITEEENKIQCDKTEIDKNISKLMDQLHEWKHKRSQIKEKEKELQNQRLQILQGLHGSLKSKKDCTNQLEDVCLVCENGQNSMVSKQTFQNTPDKHLENSIFPEIVNPSNMIFTGYTEGDELSSLLEALNSTIKTYSHNNHSSINSSENNIRHFGAEPDINSQDFPTFANKNKEGDDSETNAKNLLSIKNVIVHESSITCIEVFESYVYTGSSDKTVKRFHIMDTKQITTYADHDDCVLDLHVNRITKGETFLYTVSSNIFNVFVAETGIVLKKIILKCQISCMCGQWETIFLGTKSGKMVTFSIHTMSTEEIYVASCAIQAISTSSQGAQRLLCILSNDGMITLWDATSKLLLQCLNEKFESPCDISNNGDFLFVTTRRGFLHAYEFYADIQSIAINCCSSPSDIKIVNSNPLVSCVDGVVRCFQKSSLGWSLSSSYKVEENRKKTTLCLAEYQCWVFTGNSSGEVKVFHLNDFKMVV